MQETDDRQVMALSQRLGLPDMVCRLLAARGIGPRRRPPISDPKLRDLLPDPSSLADLDKAAARLAQAIVDGEKVAVFGDYDVDGATSSALLLRYWRACGRDMRALHPRPPERGLRPQ